MTGEPWITDPEEHAAFVADFHAAMARDIEDIKACGRLVPVSLKPAEMTECGLTCGHEGQCVPYTKLKRQVSYNEDAVLCQQCRKRIRLNNNGRVRVHISGKAGSERCPGSDAIGDSVDPFRPKP